MVPFASSRPRPRRRRRPRGGGAYRASPPAIAEVGLIPSPQLVSSYRAVAYIQLNLCAVCYEIWLYAFPAKGGAGWWQTVDFEGFLALDRLCSVSAGKSWLDMSYINRTRLPKRDGSTGLGRNVLANLVEFNMRATERPHGWALLSKDESFQN